MGNLTGKAGLSLANWKLTENTMEGCFLDHFSNIVIYEIATKMLRLL